MAVRHHMALLGVLGTVLMFHSLCVHGAVERAIFTSRELHRRVRSSFYVLGYCSSPVSPECIQLMLLLESSEGLTRDSLIKTGLLVYDSASWQKHLNTSTPTHLWFACHDGDQIRIEPISSTAPKYSAEASKATRDRPSESAAARAARAAALAADCGPGVPFYACPQLTLELKTDLLMMNLAAAVTQQGAACIAGQMRDMHPAAAAVINKGIGLPDVTAVAAAVAADPETMKVAFEQGLEMHRRQQQQPQLQQLDTVDYVRLGFLYFGVAMVVVGSVVVVVDDIKRRPGLPSAPSCPSSSCLSSSSSSSAAAAAAVSAAVTRSPASTTTPGTAEHFTRCAAASPGEAAACGSSLTTPAAGRLSQATAAPAAAAPAGPSAVTARQMNADQVSSAACPPPTAQQPAAAAEGSADVAAGNSSSSSAEEHLHAVEHAMEHAVELDLSSPLAADWADWGDWPTEGENTTTAPPATPQAAPLPLTTTTATPPPEGARAGDDAAPMSVNITLAHDPTTITITAHPQERVESFKSRVAAILGVEVDDVEEWNVTHDPVPSSSSSSSDDNSSDSSSSSSSSSSDQADAGTRDTAGATGDDCTAAAVNADSEGEAAPPVAAAAVDSDSSSSSLSEIDRLRLDNEQLKEVVTHLHRESADTRNAAAAARSAAENQLTATREALGCLQAQLDSVEHRLQEVSIVATSGTAAAAAEASAGSSRSPGDRVTLSELCGLLARHGAATDILISELASITIGYEAPSPWADPYPAPTTFEAALLLIPSQLQAARTATAAIAAMADSINTPSTATAHSSSRSGSDSDDLPSLADSPCCGAVESDVPILDRLADLTTLPPPLTTLAQASASTANVDALPAAAATAVEEGEAVELGAAADTAADQMHDAAPHTGSDSSDDEVPDSDISHLCQLPCGEVHDSFVPPDMGGVVDEYLDDTSDGGSSSSSSSGSTCSDDSIPSLAVDSHSDGDSLYTDGPPSLYDSEVEDISSDGDVPDLVGSEEYMQQIEACSGPVAVGTAQQASGDTDTDTEDMPTLESDDGNSISSSSCSSAGNDDEIPQCYQPLIDDVPANIAADTACGEPADDSKAAPASPANSTAAMVSSAAADTCSLHSVPLGAPGSAHGSREASEAAGGSNGSWDMDGGAAGACSDDGECSSDGWQQVEMMMEEQQE